MSEQRNYKSICMVSSSMSIIVKSGSLNVIVSYHHGAVPLHTVFI